MDRRRIGGNKSIEFAERIFDLSSEERLTADIIALACTAREVGAWASRAGFGAVNVVTVTKQITFPSMLDYVRFQLMATPMAALLKEKDAAEGDRVIRSISADVASRLDPSMIDGRVSV